jgi:protein-S-isoprenylcysteine O-methyltransferase Ste14
MIFRVCFILVFSLLSLVRAYFRIRTGAIHDHIFTPREGVFPVILRWILGLPLLAATGAYIFMPGLWPWMYLPIALPVRFLGIILGFFSVVLLVQVHLALGRNFSSTLVIRQGHRLIRSGPYRFVRHPMYSAYLLLFVGAFLMSANWLVGSTGVAIITTLMTIRLVREEALLVERFGAEYEEYRRTTGMFLPLTHKLPPRASKVEDLA